MTPDEQIAVTLSAGEWNQVMMYLSDQPYKLVARHIAAIQTQCTQHEVNALRQKDNMGVSGQDNR